MGYELLTGATGLLGSYLLRDALRAGKKVAVLARRSRSLTARERVQETLDRLAGPEALTAPMVLEGDLHRPLLGLDAEQLDWVQQNCTRLLHSAASLQFQGDGKSGEPYLSNLDGTRHALSLCQKTGIRELHLVSTAYVCGRREGRILENELEMGQLFSNDYERSKFVSEVLVREADWLDRWTIYRPSVIVGDSVSGYTSSYNGAYALFRTAWLFSGLTRESTLERIGLTDQDRVNIVPVDWVSTVIRHLIEQPDSAGQTYHLTSPHPPTATALYEACARAPVAPPEVPPSLLEEALSVYQPYLSHHPDFDVSNSERDAADLPCPSIDDALLDRLIDFASREGFEPPVKTLLETLPATGSPTESLLLEVNGPEGGTWSLAPSAQPGEVALAEDADGSRRAFCNPDTLEDLLARRLTLEGALYSGLLVLEGAPAQLDGSVKLLENLLEGLRTAPDRRVRR